MKAYLQIFLCILLTAGCTASRQPYEELFAGWMQKWYPGTGLVYECDIPDVCSSEGANGNFLEFTKERGYGHGMEDCALICGTALSGLSDRWIVRPSHEVKQDARRLAEGILNLASAHGAKGFVARGICPDDCKTVCSLSSRDQYTHWVHSLWRYSNSGMASRRHIREYKQRITEVAEHMEETITEKNEYNFGQPDGSRPWARIICTMWGPTLKPHEWMRLPMIYSAAYMATGDKHWKEMYERYIDEALDNTLAIYDEPSYPKLCNMPCYTLYQAVASMEIVIGYEKDPDRVERLQRAIKGFSDIASYIMSTCNPGDPPYGMCWDGELMLTKLMDPSYTPDYGFRAFLDAALLRCEPGWSEEHTKEPQQTGASGDGWCRTAHICSAFWRLERLDSGTNRK